MLLKKRKREEIKKKSPISSPRGTPPNDVIEFFSYETTMNFRADNSKDPRRAFVRSFRWTRYRACLTIGGNWKRHVAEWNSTMYCRRTSNRSDRGVVHIGRVVRTASRLSLDDCLILFVVSFVKIGIPRIEMVRSSNKKAKAFRRVPSPSKSYILLVIYYYIYLDFLDSFLIVQDFYPLLNFLCLNYISFITFSSSNFNFLFFFIFF